MGRPSKYSKGLAQQICRIIATSEKGVHAISKEVDVPASTIFDWLTDHTEFSDMYARAKALQAELMEQIIKDIADDTRNDTIHTDKGDFPNMEWINRSRLRVDTRKWLMAKLAPRKYGDKLDLTSDGKAIPAPVINVLPDKK